jgi:tRNA pseudouridine38-40 synthase
MLNIKAILAYDGTRYLGWQKTRMGPSIEGQLQSVLEQITGQSIVLQAASRTDAGVHADGQVVNFFLNKETVELPKLQLSLNRLLPGDISVLKLTAVHSEFHPTLDAACKEYHYTFSIGPVQFPRHRLYAWHYPYKLDIQAISDASRHFIGEHDFSSFCNVKKNDKETDFIRTVFSIEIKELAESRLRIIIKGNRFLYRMARNIAGTLAGVGKGDMAPAEIPEILKQKDRTQAGVTAPAHGLSLHRLQFK